MNAYDIETLAALADEYGVECEIEPVTDFERLTTRGVPYVMREGITITMATGEVEPASSVEEASTIIRLYGTAPSAAAVLGRKGGRAKTPAKADAARVNGRLGGRPPYTYSVEVEWTSRQMVVADAVASISEAKRIARQAWDDHTPRAIHIRRSDGLGTMTATQTHGRGMLWGD